MRRPLAATAAATLLLVAACGGGSGSPDHSSHGPSHATFVATSPDTGPTSPPGSPAASPPPASLPSQTDTEWGRIWDVLPEGFPVPPGAVRTEPDEAASGAFDVPQPAGEAATYMQQTLELANFSTLALSGPDEDGRIVIDSVGPGGTDCRVETTLHPLGSLTRLTIRYGAACAIG